MELEGVSVTEREERNEGGWSEFVLGYIGSDVPAIKVVESPLELGEVLR